MRINICVATLATLTLLFFNCSDYEIDGYLKDAAVKRLLTSADTTALTNDILYKVHKKEYPFLMQLIAFPDTTIRKKTLHLLRSLNQPWCFDYYFNTLHDPLTSLRLLAAEGILTLRLKDKKDLVLSEILLQNKVYTFPEERCIGNLILTLGYTGTPSDTESLFDMMRMETESRYRNLYRNVLIKLDDTLYVKELDSLLTLGSAIDKKESLMAVQYIDRIEWVEKVVPLLADETLTEPVSFGSANLSKRVCDFAIATLRVIDTGKKLPVGPLGRFPYTSEELQTIRNLYAPAHQSSASPLASPLHGM